MRTRFSNTQLANPDLASAERNLRSCVHCGICTATCPTYVLTGDERDGPRGRIVMMQSMLEANSVPTKEAVHHIDRCLSCLACRTACPSSVDYARIADAARIHIATHYERPRAERLMRNGIAWVMPRAWLVRLLAGVARLLSPIAGRLPEPFGAMARKVAIARTRAPRAADEKLPLPTLRVALMPGCVQRALAPSIDGAATRVLARRGVLLKSLPGAACCGALAHHLGRQADAKELARRNITAFEKGTSFDAVLITATGCAAHLLDYPHLFADEPDWQARARAFAGKVRDFCELATAHTNVTPRGLRVAHHVPCSQQNGIRRGDFGAGALKAAGYTVVPIPEAHLCCGSAGSYSLLQPDMASRLRARKLAHIASVAPDAIASANIGCLLHLSGADAPPVVHPAELLDWAEGGPKPAGLESANPSVKAAISG